MVVVLLGGCGIGVNGGCICYGGCSRGCGIAVGSCGSNADNGGIVMLLVGRCNGGYGGSDFGSGGGHYVVADGSYGSVVYCSCGRDGDGRVVKRVVVVVLVVMVMVLIVVCGSGDVDD